MGWRFRKSIKLGKHLRINVSNKGVGMSAGVKGARIGFNSKGVYTSVSIPGTGLSRIDYISKNKTKAGAAQAENCSAGLALPAKLKPELNSAVWIITGIVAFLFSHVLGIFIFVIYFLMLYGFTYTPELKNLKPAREAFERGNVFLLEDKYDLALINFEEVNNMFPDLPEVISALAMLYFKTGNYVKAKIYLRKYLAVHPNDDTAKEWLTEATQKA